MVLSPGFPFLLSRLILVPLVDYFIAFPSSLLILLSHFSSATLAFLLNAALMWSKFLKDILIFIFSSEPYPQTTFIIGDHDLVSPVL